MFKSVYHFWMKFAEKLNRVVSFVLFSLLYLFVVPVFTILSHGSSFGRLKDENEAKTFWHQRDRREIDSEFLKRMG